MNIILYIRKAVRSCLMIQEGYTSGFSLQEQTQEQKAGKFFREVVNAGSVPDLTRVEQKLPTK